MKFEELAIGDEVVVNDRPDAIVYKVRAHDQQQRIVALSYVNGSGMTVRGGWIDPSICRRPHAARASANAITLEKGISP